MVLETHFRFGFPNEFLAGAESVRAAVVAMQSCRQVTTTSFRHRVELSCVGDHGREKRKEIDSWERPIEKRHESSGKDDCFFPLSQSAKATFL
jgi:hypothetical protein